METNKEKDETNPLPAKQPAASRPAPWMPPDVPEPVKEKKQLTRSEIETQLQGRKAAIKARLDALEDEVMTTGEALKDAVVRSPWVAVGGAVAAGLVVGLLFGGRKRKDALAGHEAHRALVQRYVDTLVADVRYAVAGGADVDEAVEEALQDRTPLIVFSPNERRSTRGLFGEFAIMALQTALGFAMKAAADYLTAQLDFVTVEEEVHVEEDGHADGTSSVETTVKRTVSESQQR